MDAATEGAANALEAAACIIKRNGATIKQNNIGGRLMRATIANDVELLTNVAKKLRSGQENLGDWLRLANDYSPPVL